MSTKLFGGTSLEEIEARKEKRMKEKQEIEQNVNHPAHYTQSSIECIDAIKASMSIQEFKGMLKGDAIKYLWRYENKGKPVEDLKKAVWYIERLIEEIENE